MQIGLEFLVLYILNGFLRYLFRYTFFNSDICKLDANKTNSVNLFLMLPTIGNYSHETRHPVIVTQSNSTKRNISPWTRM